MVPISKLRAARKDDAMPEVHCYDLKRATPSFNPPPDKDGWHIPGASSASEALMYFEREIGFRLRLLESDDDETGEFVLEQRERLPSRHGPGVQPGEITARWWVARVTG
jgi:hypothetical protein